MGVVSGNVFVNGHPRGKSFQRQTGYVQQQDIHLETSTVREALRFSAVLRQSSTASTEEKYLYVEEVIQLLDMGQYADAVIGVPGEGVFGSSMLVNWYHSSKQVARHHAANLPIIRS